MGTDIHMVVQTLRPGFDGYGPYWYSVLPPRWWPRDEYDTKRVRGLRKALPDASAAAQLAYVLGEWYGDRNYDLFAILADVRNGTGFAGVQTLTDAWPVIAAGRGLPEGFELNANNGHDVGLYGADMWIGDHSYTWLTLAELLAYPWKETTAARVGVVSLARFAAKHTGGADYTGWSGGIYGPGITVIGRDEALVRLTGEGVAESDQSRVYVQDAWPVTAYEACRWWCDKVMPGLVRYAKEQKVSHDQVRLVMGFDS